MNAVPTWFLVFWVVFLTIWIIALSLLAYFLGFRKLGIVKRCTCLTEGRVISYSMIRYNGISLPVVEYVIDGVAYRVVGPKFKATATSSWSTPTGPVITEVRSNLIPGQPLPKVLRLNTRGNSLASAMHSPLAEFYPVGGSARVFFNPDRPKESFVERWAGAEKVMLWVTIPSLFLILAVLAFILTQLAA